jgi:hypothetical protein
MNALIDLSGLGTLKKKEQSRRTALFQKRWSYQLRRLYPGTDFLWLAPVLMNASSDALRGFLNQPQESAESPLDPEP